MCRGGFLFNFSRKDNFENSYRFSFQLLIRRRLASLFWCGTLMGHNGSVVIPGELPNVKVVWQFKLHLSPEFFVLNSIPANRM